MRTSHRQIRKRILDAKSKISDEEFFSSRAYNGYLTDLAEAATKRYKRPLRVRVVADHDDDTVAFTDYHGIYINACNHITWSLPTRLLRSMSLEGFNAHECGHNLFTDNRIGTATSANWRRANSTRRCLTVWTVCKSSMHATSSKQFSMRPTRFLIRSS